MDKLMASLPAWTGHGFTETIHHQVPAALNANANTLPSPFVLCITGASRGIGKATAETFARAGATGLILTARKVESLEDTVKICKTSAKSSELLISVVALESGNEDDTNKLGEVVTKEHGRLDLLINNAGLVSTKPNAFGKLLDIDTDQFRITMECNYMGRMLTMKTLMPILFSTPNGAKVVINITSICSHFTATAAMGFNISELASNRLTEIAAETYADQGLVCYSVHPGWVNTTPPPGLPVGAGSQATDEPGLCGAFCLWLVRKRPEWLNGRYLSSDWDTDELEAKREEIVEGDKLRSRMVI